MSATPSPADLADLLRDLEQHLERTHCRGTLDHAVAHALHDRLGVGGGEVTVDDVNDAAALLRRHGRL